jgi:anti-sigma regulatory factor (Ser/Thr protein kinase)
MAGTDALIIETQSTAPIGVLRISGRLSKAGTGRLLARLSDALLASGRLAVVCDLTGLQAPDDDALLTVFPAALRRAGGWPETELHLAGPDPALWAALYRAAVHRYLPIHPSANLALAAADSDQVIGHRQLALPAEPRAVRLARAAMVEMWPRAGRGRDDAVLVTNELATNAIQHAGRPFTLTVTLSARHTLIAVTDHCPGEPVIRLVDSIASRGRGLYLVVHLSRDWGVRLVHPEGKTVWAMLAPPVPMIPRARPPLR